MLVPTPTYEIIVTGKTYPVKESLKSEDLCGAEETGEKLLKIKNTDL